MGNPLPLKCPLKPAVSASVALILSAVSVLQSPQAAFADDAPPVSIAPAAPAPRSLAAVDKELYLELIKLSRFNVRFHLEANRHQRWRSVTYPLGRESGTALVLAGNLIDIRQQSRGLNNPRRINRDAIENGLASSITGNALSGCASALELAQNTWMMSKATRQGFSPRESVGFVKNVVARTDALFVEREQFTAMESYERRRRVRELETELLKRIRQQLLFEFRSWSCHSRDQAWRENTFYTLDSLQSFTRMTAGILARRALDEPDLAGGSIVCALTASSIATLNPIVRNFIGLSMRKHQERKLAREFPSERPAMPAGMSLDELTELQKHVPGDRDHEELLTSALLLSDRSERIDVNLDKETREIERFRQIAQQQTVSGPLIGLTGVAGGTLSAVAFYGYRKEPKTAIRIGFSGRLSSVTGLSYAILNTPYTVISGAIRNKRLRDRGEAPQQILEERLKNLDRFEAQVKAVQP